MSTYAKFAAVTPQSPCDQNIGDDARDQAVRSVGPGLVTLPEVADYLQIGRRSIRCVLQEHGVPVNPAGRVRWADLWKVLWLIPEVPPAQYSMMMRPLLSVAETANRVGVCAKSIIRDSGRKHPRYGLPRHLQLSDRTRRFHPEMILLWEMNEALEDWMHPVASRVPQFRGLRPRRPTSKQQIPPAEAQSSDKPAGKVKNDNRSS